MTTLSGTDTTLWSKVLDRLAKSDHRNDPVAWARDQLGEHCWSKQADIMNACRDNRLVAVQSCHGVGKSHLASRMALWFLDTHPIDSTMVITSAPTSHQVSAVLWRYIRQGHAKANLAGYITQGTVPEWKIDGNMVAFGRKPADHARSSFQGLHADHMLVILDEAGGIPKWLWDAADSLMTGEDDQHLLAIGNPDDNSAHFHTVCTTEPNWTRFQISAFDAPAYTGEQVPPELLRQLVGPTYVDDKRERWGEQSALYRVKVLGEFVDSEDGLIPLSWVRAAVARWNTWDEAGRPELGRRIIGCDVARYGEDATVLAIRENDVLRELKVHTQRDTVETAAAVARELDWPRAIAMVDVIGVGAGVVDMLRAGRRNVVAFNAARKTNRTDSTNEWRFLNVRSAAWWNLRELLDPSKGATIALPDDEDLIADLTTPTWRIGNGNTVLVESKDSMRKRLNRSTDRGDAVCMAFWWNPSTGRGDSDDDTPRPPSTASYADSPDWGEVRNTARDFRRSPGPPRTGLPGHAMPGTDWGMG